MKDVSPGPETIQVEGDFFGFTPQELFDHWVKPELLVEWWPREATVDPHLGGHYTFSWPEQGWELHGTYFDFEPGKALGFTWLWNFDKDRTEPLRVELRFSPIEGGTHLSVTHGPWGPSPESQTERQGVIEGWIHFGMRLAGLRESEAT